MALGLNVHRWDGEVADALRVVRPPFMVVTGTDAAGPDWDLLEQLHSEFPFVVAWRPMPQAGKYDNDGIEPDVILRYAIPIVRQHPRLQIVICPYNEVLATSNLSEQLPRELLAVRLFHAQGVPVIAGNIGTGQIEPDQIPLLLDLWREAAAIGVHAYLAKGADSLFYPDNRYTVRRPGALWLSVLRRYHLDLTACVATESGTDESPYRVDSAGRRILSPEESARLMIAIHLSLTGQGYRQTAPFTLSAQGRFANDGEQPFEIVGTAGVAVLAEFNRQHPGQPPVFTILKSAPKPAPKPRSALGGKPKKMPDKPAVTQILSPNFGYPNAGAHGRGAEHVMAIIDHIAAGTAAGLDATFMTRGGVSAHFAVMKSGMVHQYVAEEDAAWAAGILNHPDVTLPWLPPPDIFQGRLVNQRSLSVEQEGQPGDVFPSEQIAATIALHRYLVARWGVPVDRDHIVGHYRLDSVNRVNCPGPTFPWEELFAALGEEPMDKVKLNVALDALWAVKTALEQAGDGVKAAQILDAVVNIKVATGLQPA